MKNTILTTVMLFTALSVATVSTPLYADDSSCTTCGCRKPTVDPGNVTRESINPDQSAQGQSQGDIKTQ